MQVHTYADIFNSLSIELLIRRDNSFYFYIFEINKEMSHKGKALLIPSFIQETNLSWSRHSRKFIFSLLFVTVLHFRGK